MSSAPEADKQGRLTRRGFLKWSTALAAAGAAVVGVAAGFGSDLLLRPNTERKVTTTVTTTETATQTTTATTTVSAPVQTIVQNAPPSTAVTPAAETISYTAHRTGPLRVHVINGRWVRSSVIKPNLPTAYRLLGMRNRTYAPDRVRYPMKRLGWVPGGTSDVSNRGKGEFVRISWDEAFASVASEIKRIYQTYGPSAAFASSSGHQWPSTVEAGEKWAKNLLAAMGGYTSRTGGESFTGWNDASFLSWGLGSPPAANTFGDLVKNCKQLVYWGVDHSGKCWVSTETALMLPRYKAAGVKLVVIDPWFNETAAHNADKWISLVPGTDEALLAAIAYVWIQEGTYNKAWVDSHVLGFDEDHLPAGAPPNSSFKSYILGVADGVPKTPEWAAGITGTRKETILAFAHEWASKPTYVDSYSGGPQRRAMAGQFVRMLIAVCSMQGLGMPGRGLGYALWASSNNGISNPITSVGGAPPSLPNPVTQVIQHVLIPDAIMGGGKTPVSWTSGHSPVTGGPLKLTYPAQGYVPVRMYYGAGGSDLTQRPGGSFRFAQAFQSPNLEFVCVQVADWTGVANFADIVLPVSYVPENEDIIAWHNYIIYNKPAIPRPYEAKSDMEIVYELASRLGVLDKVSGGKDLQGWLQNAFANLSPKPSAALNAQPATFDDFKKMGYLEYAAPDLAADLGGFAAFNTDPVKNKLPTPSGKIEIYSQQIQGFWGNNDPVATVVPKYIPSPENRLAPRARQYPLEFMSIHGFYSEHEQYHHMTWARDDQATFASGYIALWMNPIDANARGLKQGDVVRVFNDRGQTLFGVRITERVKPGLTLGLDGGNWKPMQPGVQGSLDMGSVPNIVLPQTQADPTCDGMITWGLVQVEKWKGA